MFVLSVMLATVMLVALTIVLPLRRWARQQVRVATPSAGGIGSLVGIGIGFMLVEIAMMQQRSILLSQPIYLLVVLLSGLILSSGVGSLISDRLPFGF